MTDASDEQHDYALSFTGSGREYFRIWIVNLCLTVATLGVYSAWAKVRRLQYFNRNTLLDGAAFNFHGRPGPILRGRLLVLAAAITYHYAFGFSLAFGLGMAGAIVIGLPVLLVRALRFRLGNTSYRGLRFGFVGSVGGAYEVYLPPILMFLLPGVLAPLGIGVTGAGLVSLGYLAWPYLHARMKDYQHNNFSYGDQASEYAGTAGEFFIIYLKAIGWGLLGGVLLSVLMGGAMFAIKDLKLDAVPAAAMIGMIVGLLFVYLAYLMSGPYIQAQVARLVWNNTVIERVSFVSDLPPLGFVRLQFVHAVLTLLTLGLFRPFAAVRTYRYRLAHTRVHTFAPLDTVLAGAQPPAAGTAGDMAADMAGFDLAW